MNMIEALRLCQGGGWRVRPVCWQRTNPNHWVELRGGRLVPAVFVESGSREEMPHALRLSTPDEFLGEWETVET